MYRNIHIEHQLQALFTIGTIGTLHVVPFLLHTFQALLDNQ